MKRYISDFIKWSLSPLTWSAFLRIVVGRAKVVPDLVGQGQLGNFGRDPGVVVDEGDYSWTDFINPSLHAR